MGLKRRCKRILLLFCKHWEVWLVFAWLHYFSQLPNIYSAAQRIGGLKPFSSCVTTYPFAGPWDSRVAASSEAGGAASQTPCPSCGSFLQLETPLDMSTKFRAFTGGKETAELPHWQCLGSLASLGNACVLVYLAGDTGFSFHSWDVQNSSKTGVRQPPIPTFLSTESAITMLFAHKLAERAGCLRLFPDTIG